MEISFGSKDEHKREQEKAFLALSPAERFYAFLRLSERMAKFPRAEKDKKDLSKNFVIEIKVER